MKRISLIGVLLFSILIISCNKNNESRYTKIKKFPKEINLKSEIIKHDLILGLHDIYLLDDSLALFFTLYDENYCLRIVNINNYKLVKSSGTIGRGPGEIGNPSYVYYDKLNRNIWVSSGIDLKIYKFSLDSMLLHNNYIPTNYIEFSKDKLVINYTIENDSLEYFNSIWNDHIMFKVKNNKIVHKFIEKHIISENKINDMNLNFGGFVFHPNKKKLVNFYIHDDLLIFAKSSGEIIKKVKGPVFIDAIESVKKGILKAAYQKIVADEKYIYCLFRGGVEKGTKDKYGRSLRKDANSILVFNWDGEPVKRINVDRSMYQFEIDKKRNRFLAYCAEIDGGLISINYEFE